MSSVDNIRARADAAFNPIQSRIEPLIDSLSPRDRMLALGLVSFGGMVVVGFVGWWMNSTLAGLRTDIADRHETLAFVVEAAAEYASSQVELDRIEKELSRHAETDLSAFMEKAAQSAHLGENLDRANLTRTTEIPTSSLEQKDYDVSLSKVELEKFLNFLHAIETDGYPLRITNAAIKSVTVRGEKLLNVKMDVAAFKLLEEEG